MHSKDGCMRNYDPAPESIWQKFNKIYGRLTRQESIDLQQIVKQLPPGSKIVELGVSAGRSSIIIASVLPTGSILYCVDDFSWSWDVLSTFMKNIEEFSVNDKIRFLIMDNVEAAKEFEDESVQMVFINAEHNCESAKQNILHWCPKMKSGGFLVCHICPGYSGVNEAIKGLQLNGALISSDLWCGQKV